MKSPHVTKQIIAALILGILAGVVFPTASVSLGILGIVLIQLIKVVALPLVFFSIVDSIVTSGISLKTGRRVGIVVIFNSFFALIVALSLVNLLEPGKSLIVIENSHSIVSQSGGMDKSKTFSVENILQGLVPKSALSPFLDNNILGVVLIALVVGISLRGEINGSNLQVLVKDVLALLLRVTERSLGWVIRLVPVAVFGVSAQAMSLYGFSGFKSLLWYLGVILLGFSIHVSTVYSFWLFYFAKRHPLDLVKRVWPAVIYGFGTSSSLATIPVTLKSLSSLGVRTESARTGACIVTNFNNDGIILYEVIAALFVAQSLGYDYSISQQFFIAVLSIVGAMGVAGVPEAGIVSLTLVLSSVGLSQEILPLLLSVDWLISRCRTVVNVLADITVSVALDAMTGNDES